jgi:hypothetical protein
VTEAAKVSVVSEPGVKRQWGRGFLYRKEGGKNVLNGKAVVISSSFGLIVLIIWSLLFDQGSPESVEASPLRLKNDMTSNPKLDLPAYDSSEPVPKVHQMTERQQRKRPGIGVIQPSLTQKIPPGVFAKAVLLSGGAAQFARAELTEPLRVNRETILPQGTLLVGSGSSSEDRLYLEFKQAVFKDGSVAQVAAKACDAGDHIVGIKGSQVGNRSLKLGAAVALNFATGLSQGLQKTEAHNGVEVKRNDMRNALLNGASAAALEESKDLMSGIRSKPNEIEVPAGTNICILFSGEQSSP